jgi:hypothetical protein
MLTTNSGEKENRRTHKMAEIEAGFTKWYAFFSDILVFKEYFTFVLSTIPSRFLWSKHC